MARVGDGRGEGPDYSYSMRKPFDLQEVDRNPEPVMQPRACCEIHKAQDEMELEETEARALLAHVLALKAALRWAVSEIELGRRHGIMMNQVKIPDYPEVDYPDKFASAKVLAGPNSAPSPTKKPS